MKNLMPATMPVPDFTPVPRKYRFDGWTADRQRAFIAALAETGSVTSAAARINMSSEGAYCLRRQPGADSFRAAWAAALDHGVQCLTDLAIDRARDGVAVPVFWQGEQVGERRHYNDRLLMFVLRHHLPERYDPAHRDRAADAEARATAEARACEEARADDDAYFTELASALIKLMRSHRVLLRNAVLLSLMGDTIGAANCEYRASQVEQVFESGPEHWVSKSFMIDVTRRYLEKPLPYPDEADPAFCRPRDESIDAGEYPEDAPSMRKWVDGDGVPTIPDLPIPEHIRRRVEIQHWGFTAHERMAARADALARIEHARAEWLASATEEDWAAWIENGRRA